MQLCRRPQISINVSWIEETPFCTLTHVMPVTDDASSDALSIMATPIVFPAAEDDGKDEEFRPQKKRKLPTGWEM